MEKTHMILPADMVSPWASEGFAPVLLDTIFCGERSHPKGNLPAGAAHKQDTGVGGTWSVVASLHPDISFSAARPHPGGVSCGDSPLFAPPREEDENKQKRWVDLWGAAGVGTSLPKDTGMEQIH